MFFFLQNSKANPIFSNLQSETVTEIPDWDPILDPCSFSQMSSTVWSDSKMTSWVRDEHMECTIEKSTHVDRVEYLTEVPLYWPVHKTCTAFVLDLRNNPTYNITDDDGLKSIDWIIKNYVCNLIFVGPRV